MIKFIFLIALSLSYPLIASDDEFDSIENQRMRSAEKALNLIEENVALVGCIAFDYVLQNYFCPDEVNNIKKDMLIITAKTLLLDIIEQTAGKNYKHMFTNTVFILGIYLAPEATIGAYATAYLAKQFCEQLQITPIKQRIVRYFAARFGGALGKLWLPDMNISSRQDASCFSCCPLPKP